MIEFEAGDVIDDRFEVLVEIGRGGMGIVLEVTDTESGDRVALKYCPERDRTAKRRFAREVRIMAGIDHAHVMPVLAYSESCRPPYFVMPIAECSLADEISDGLDLDDALEIFKSMCLGAHAIHSAGSTHRDIKPENVMRLDDGRIVISDLGLARLTERDTTTLTQTAVFLGTRMYCAPEQLLLGGSREADARTDVYQLGKVLYELVTGDQPAVIDSNLIPAGLDYIIDRSTQQHPDRRYQTVGQLMDAVENFVRAQDPHGSAHEAFEAALAQARTMLKDERYDSDNLENLLELLLQMTEDEDFYLEQFERIPRRLLRIMARRMPEHLERPVARYGEAVAEVIGGYNFEHAEVVAKRMKAVFDASERPVLKVAAVRATMIAAVNLNRFAAMEVFDEMIVSVSTADIAAPLAEMLRENYGVYQHLQGRVPAGKLHGAIRRVEAAD